jgi:hypothetical protein
LSRLQHLYWFPNNKRFSQELQDEVKS